MTVNRSRLTCSLRNVVKDVFFSVLAVTEENRKMQTTLWVASLDVDGGACWEILSVLASRAKGRSQICKLTKEVYRLRSIWYRNRVIVPSPYLVISV